MNIGFLKHIIRNGTVVCVALAMSGGAFADSGEKRLSDTRVQGAMQMQKASPCVNPDAPCPGAPVIFNARKLQSLGKDRAKKHVRSRIIGNFPDTKEAMLEGDSGLIIALLAAAAVREDSLGGQGDTDIIVRASGCCKFEITFKITFGKK